MEGSVFISFSDGWSCSNDCRFDVEKDIIEDKDGGKLSKQTLTLKIGGLFNGKGKLEINKNVDCVFKNEDDGGSEKRGFKGIVTAQTPRTTVITLSSKISNITEILTKIKEDIQNEW